MIYSGVPQSYVIKYCIMATVWEPPNQSPNASKFATQGHQINMQQILLSFEKYLQGQISKILKIHLM